MMIFMAQNPKNKMFIDGEWVDSSSGEKFEVRDPSTGKVFENVPSASSEDVDKAVESARNTFDNGSME